MYFNHIIYQKERCLLWREINTLPSISSLTDRDFPIFRQKKVRVRSVGDAHQSGFSRADTINTNIDKRSKRFRYYNIPINTIIHWKNNLKNAKKSL